MSSSHLSVYFRRPAAGWRRIVALAFGATLLVGFAPREAGAQPRGRPPAAA